LRYSWDEVKRRVVLARRGLDFADAAQVFAGWHFRRLDNRRGYGELRYITAGHLDGRFVVVAWTPRDGGRRIISLRYGHEREEARYRQHLEGS